MPSCVLSLRDDLGVAADPARDRRVAGSGGIEYLIQVEPAPKVGLWSHGPWRWWSTITRDSSWWLTVKSTAVGWPVVRERYRTAEAAEARFRALEGEIRSGSWAAPGRPPIRRRRG